METLFPDLSSAKPQKKAKLGRYERIQRELLNDASDVHKVLIDVREAIQLVRTYHYHRLVFGRGGHDARAKVGWFETRGERRD
jgi:DNA (cytosine-5)-methyltransferase 1